MHELLYGITTSLVVTITDRYYGSVYYLYFADHVNAWPQNPPSSNPFRIFLDCREIVRTNDVYNPKFIAHQRAVRKGIRANLAAGTPERQQAYQTVRTMGTHGLNPYLAILEQDTYNSAPGHMDAPITALPPHRAGSPTSVEYLLRDVRGPRYAIPYQVELHLEQLYF